MNVEDVCTSTIGSDGAGPLAATGVDGSILGSLAFIAAASLIAGVIVLLCRRRAVAGTVAAAGLIAIVVFATSPTSPAAAQESGTGCSLIHIDSVQASNPTELLPGQSADGLRYHVTNIAAFPIDVVIGTTLPDGGGTLENTLQATVTVQGTESDKSVFADSPGGGPILLEPGNSLTVDYLVALPDAADNSAQSQTLSYDSTVTATQR
ncbi:hypothetical protein ACIGEP_01630 [Microbacterium sp. NPDC077663]|uniref:hypothetical protein n=1 Tax=Microbacterium sp. NPDC077663 TaxID=3364189 RepID=UPI0037C588DB